MTLIHPLLDGLVWGGLQPAGMLRDMAPPFIEPSAVKVKLILLFTLLAKRESGIALIFPVPSPAVKVTGAVTLTEG